MKKLLLSALLTGLATQAIAENVFISEYIEGGSQNKAIEIYNGTGASIDLSEYAVLVYANGATSPTSTITLSNTLASGDVYVVANPSANAAILAVADQTSGSVSFNGNDAVELQHNDTPIDLFGVIGEDPGSSGWGSVTANHTLVRVSSVVEGVAVWASSEWDVYAQDTFTYLGSHTSGGGGNLLPVIANVTQTPEFALDGVAVSISAEISDSDGTVSNVDFIYSVDGGTEVSTTLTGVAGVYTGSVPGQIVGSEIAYRFEATDDDSDTAISSGSYLVYEPATLSVGDLVVTEIMKDPSVVLDAAGEWFEIYNASAAQINLNGLTISDDNTNTFTVDTDVFVDAGTYALLAVNGDNATNGGLPSVDYVYPSNFYLGNGTDAVVIYDSYLAIDRVEYSDAFFPDVAGHSMGLVDLLADNNVGANWVADAVHSYGAGDYGTPRAANDLSFDPYPVIENVTALPALVTPTDDVVVTADVSDDSALTSVNLIYNVDAGADVTLAMTEVRSYTATIPAQVEGSVVAWRIEATDDATQTMTYGPESYTVTGTAPVLTIAQIQACDVDGNSLYDGQFVTTTGIVSALCSVGSGSFFIQDASAAWSGIQVYGGNAGVAVGDEVTVTAVVDEYNGQTEIIIATTADYAVLSSGNTPYAPLALTAATAGDEQYESVLATVENLNCDALPNGFGEWFGIDNGDSLMVDDLFGTFFTPTVGECYNLTGVVYYAYGAFRIEPRTTADVATCGGENLPPAVASFYRTPTLPTSADAVVVNITVTDDSAVSAVDLYYIVDGGTANVVSMALTTGDVYEGTIPALTDGSDVEYYVIATDDQSATTESYHRMYTVTDVLSCGDISVYRVNDSEGFPVRYGQTVMVCGVLTSAAELGSTGPAYLHGATGDICAYGTLNGAVTGDEVTIVGSIGFYNGLTQLTSPTVTVVSSGNAITPTVVTLAELIAGGESYEANYVQVNGLSVVAPEEWPAEGSYNTLEVTDGVDYFNLFIDNSTDIDGSPVPAGSFDLVAVVGQYDNTSVDGYHTGYQLIPRSLADITEAGGLDAPVVTATYTAGQIELTWTAITGATDYKIYTCVGDPYEAANWDAGQSTFGMTTWTISSPTGKEFYRVTAE